MPHDEQPLGARVLRPDRPRLAAARAAVAGLVDPAEAWLALALAGVIPEAWLADPARRFPVAVADREVSAWATYSTHGGRWRMIDAPPTLGIGLALAGDPEGVAAAEALASEAARRLRPWSARAERDGAEPARAEPAHACPCAWLLATGDPRRPLVPVADHRSAELSPPHPLGSLERTVHGPSVIDVVEIAARLALGEAAWSETRGYQRRTIVKLDCQRALAAVAGARHGESVAGALIHALVAAYAWRRAAAARAVVVPHPFGWEGPQIPESLVGRSFADLPDPLEPVLAIWQLGYALDAFTEREAVLVAAEPD